MESWISEAKLKVAEKLALAESLRAEINKMSRIFTKLLETEKEKERLKLEQSKEVAKLDKRSSSCLHISL